VAPREKNGPALAGHGAERCATPISRTITNLPEQLRRSLTWDQGAENGRARAAADRHGFASYFCDPRSPWQRGTKREYQRAAAAVLSQRNDLGVHRPDDLAAVAAALNGRRARHSDGERPPKPSTRSYNPVMLVLRRPVEPGLNASVAMVNQTAASNWSTLVDRLLQARLSTKPGPCARGAPTHDSPPRGVDEA